MARKSPVQILRIIASANELLGKASPSEQEAWSKATLRWERDWFGECHVVAADVHRDEVASHLHAVVIPIDEDGRLVGEASIGKE